MGGTDVAVGCKFSPNLRVRTKMVDILTNCKASDRKDICCLRNHLPSPHPSPSLPNSEACPTIPCPAPTPCHSQVSEQMDSLRVLFTDPVDYLVTPRVLASMIAGPILNVLCFCMGASGRRTSGPGLGLGLVRWPCDRAAAVRPGTSVSRHGGP